MKSITTIITTIIKRIDKMQIDKTRIIVTIVVLGAVATIVCLVNFLIGLLISLIVSEMRAPTFFTYLGFWASLVITLATGARLLYKFFYKSIREIPYSPPHKAILTFFGRRQRRVLKEGWNYLPLYPFVFNAVPINMTSFNQDLPEQDVRTPDGANLLVKVNITWTPGALLINEIEEAEALITFLNKGGREGVAAILQDIVADRLRMWLFSKEEGPANWQEAIGAQDEAIAVLIKAVLGEDIPSIPSSIPTNVLFKYFNVPPKEPLQYEKKHWGSKSRGGSSWEKLEDELNKLSSKQLQDLKEAVEHRRYIITKARQGNGAFVKKSLGITINRFTISSVVLKGHVAETADLQAKEMLEQSAEKTELAHVRDRTKMLKKALNISSESAAEIVQTERGKVKKDISEKKYNISSETQEAIKGVVSLILQAWKKS